MSGMEMEIEEEEDQSSERSLDLTLDLAVTSEYRFRGVDLSGGDPAPQANLVIAHKTGFYAGAFASTLDDDLGFGEVELDLFAGWSKEIRDGVVFDVGFIAYTYPDAPSGDFDYYEGFASLEFVTGPASTKIGVAYDPSQQGLNFGGTASDDLYFLAETEVEIPDTPITLGAHLGYTDGALTFTQDGTAFDWSISAQWAVNDTFSLSAAYIDVDGSAFLDSLNQTDAGFVATVSASF